jgi:hypothetical protein
MRLFVLATLAALASNAALADKTRQMTLGDLQEICSATDDYSRAACRYYILGVEEGTDLASRLAKDTGRFCVPVSTRDEATVVAVKTAMVADLAVYPKDREMPAVSFVAAAIVHAYPCPKSN